MAIFKCKMCGGELLISEGMTVCECAYCGTVQTLPKLEDGKRENLYDRANHFRRNNDYDKAMSIYEQILTEDTTDAEAYWSIVLCRYGIEYVEDPATHKRIPTVNRAQYKSIYSDEDYKAAIENADVMQKQVYEAEAKTIDDIQKGILAISNKEKPFDVFICYKETDANGQRTRDSVIANDMYHQLEKEGFKTFFAAITLEGKLGSAYEPYIFAALNSARVMIVLGTKPEYFVAPWVKNEWSRFLTIIKNDKSKILIPAYRDMDPYELPEEFSFLQAQDMGKIGFMNDIIHGIKKVLGGNEDKKATGGSAVQRSVSIGSKTDAETLLERAFLFLSAGNWENATVYCDKVLDVDPGNAKAYLGKLLASKRLKSQSDLSGSNEVLSANSLFKAAYANADEKLKKELDQYVETSIENTIAFVTEQAAQVTNENDYLILIQQLQMSSGFEKIDLLIRELNERYKNLHAENEYTKACELLNCARTELDYHEAAKILKEIEWYSDASELVIRCEEQEKNLAKQSGMCAICRKVPGTTMFIPHNQEIKCCSNCFARLSALQNNIGQDNQVARNSHSFLKTAVDQVMTFSLAIDRVNEFIGKYEASLPELYGKTEDESGDTSQSDPNDLSNSIKIEYVNKDYEYDVQVVIDIPGGGVDNEMLKFILDKYSADGWKLHSIMRDSRDGGAGQVVVVFERKYRK